MYYNLFHAFQSKDALLFDKIQNSAGKKMETNLVLIFKCPKSKMVWHKTRCLKNGISAYIFVLFMCQFLNVILKFRN